MALIGSGGRALCVVCCARDGALSGRWVRFRRSLPGQQRAAAGAGFGGCGCGGTVGVDCGERRGHSPCALINRQLLVVLRRWFSWERDAAVFSPIRFRFRCFRRMPGSVQLAGVSQLLLLLLWLRRAARELCKAAKPGGRCWWFGLVVATQKRTYCTQKRGAVQRRFRNCCVARFTCFADTDREPSLLEGGLCWLVCVCWSVCMFLRMVRWRRCVND